MGKSFERHFPKEYISEANKHMKSCSTSPVLSQMQITTIMNAAFYLLQWGEGTGGGGGGGSRGK